MSEPTGGNQKPNPGSGQDSEEVQDQSPDPGFSDPTAPVWADPTAPMPPAPTPPGPQPADQQPEADPQGTPPTPPPISNPYAQQPPPPPQPYAQTTDPYGRPQPPDYSQQYGQQPGQQYPAYGQPQPPEYSLQDPAYGQPQPGQFPGQQYYATGPHTETNASAIVLTIASGIIMLSTCFLIGTPSLVFGIMALTSNTKDPAGSRKKARTGWIIFAINVGIVVLLGVAAIALLVANSTPSPDPNLGF